MATTYRLRPNITWHDGTPLTAQDFAFSWRVYTTPDFGLAGLQPHGLVDDNALTLGAGDRLMRATGAAPAPAKAWPAGRNWAKAGGALPAPALRNRASVVV